MEQAIEVEPKNQPVKVIGLTPAQQEDFSKYVDGQMFSDLPMHDSPTITQEQLDSIPDVIDGIKIDETDKIKLYTGNGVDEGLKFEGRGVTYSIDANSNLTRETLMVNEHHHEDISSVTSLVLINEVQFKNNVAIKQETPIISKVENQNVSSKVDIAELKTSLAQMSKEDLKVLTDTLIEFNSPGETVVWDKKKAELTIHEFSIIPENHTGIKSEGGKDLKERHSMPVSEFATILREVENTKKEDVHLKADVPIENKAIQPVINTEKSEFNLEKEMQSFSNNLFAGMMAKSQSNGNEKSQGLKI